MANPDAASEADASVFISYSRNDTDFVSRLQGELAAHKRIVWVDLQNIDPTLDWWKEICRGIEKTPNFIFIVSPDLIASPICQLELDYARQSAKRIIPIRLRETNQAVAFGKLAANPLDDFVVSILGGREILVIARSNWFDILRLNNLDFSHTDDFESGFRQLLETIEKDHDYIDRHTYLLNRAREWERKARSDSLLLHGDELQEAQVWITRSIGKNPLPSDLHRKYIETSYGAEGRRIKMEGRLTAEVREAQERANRLTKRFLYFIGVILLIGVSAYFGGRGSQIHALDETARSDDATSWSPDETRIVTIDTASSDKLVYIWDTASGDKLFTLVGHTGTVRDAEWSPDGTQIATGSIDDTAKIWDAATGKELFTLSGHTDNISVVAWSPDDKRLVTAGDDRTARVWDTSTGKILMVFALHTSAITSAHWSQDGSEIITTDHNRTTRIWNAATGTERIAFSGHG